MSSSLKFLYFFLVEKLFQVTGDPGFVIGEAPHCSGGDGVVHSDADIVSQTLSHGIDVISMWLIECIPVFSLKTLPGFSNFL